MKLSTMLLAGAMIFGTASICAQTATPGVMKTDYLQKERIAEGVQSGELTKGEAAQLHQVLKRNKRMKGLTTRDGVVTRHERAVLRDDKASASAKIHRLKNNNVTR